MININGKYAHLYNTVQYIPPSIIRKIEEAKSKQAQTFNTINVNRGNSIESISGQSQFDRFLNYELRGRDIYSDMKNKILYSLSSEISTHVDLNTL